MQTILKYFPEISDNQKQQFAMLKDIYTDWNSKINVISRRDFENLYLRHVLHSLSIANVIQFKNGTRIIDVGTGGGFPGIPLAILFPNARFTLIDSIKIKIKVVNDVIRQLKLENAEGIPIRSTEIKRKNFEFIVSRAVSNFPAFLKATNNLISQISQNRLPNGIFYLKGGDVEKELEDFKNKVVIYSISKFFEEEYFTTKKIVYYPF